MLSYYFCCSLLAILIGETLFFSSAFGEPARDLIILTDMETDDRIALTIVAARKELSERLMFVGTTLLNTELKAALARKQLKDSGLDVPVFAGTGGPPSSYPNNVETAKAALKFWHEEGKGILTDEELMRFRDKEMAPVEANDSNPDDEVVAGMSQIENLWSIVIEGLPESKAAKQDDRYQEDYDTVITLLDMINMDIPPKFVYRMPKPRGILTNAPRLLKVFFPVSLVAPIVVTKWEQYMRGKSEFVELKIHYGMKSNAFEKVKNHFFNGVKKIQKAKSDEEEGIIFYDAKDEFSDENEDANEDGRKKKKKNKKKKTKKGAEKNTKNEQTIIGKDDEVSSSHMAGIDFEVIREILCNEEEKRSIVIKGLYEYRTTAATSSHNHNARKEDRTAIPSLPLPSECYKRDFEMTMDILYAIGVEISPLAVHRLSGDLDARGRRYLQVIFRSKKVVEYVQSSWNRLRWLIRNKKPEWNWLSITGFKTNDPDPMENEIEGKKEQWSEFLGYLKDATPIQEGNQLDKKDKGKGIASSSKTTKVRNNQLQEAFINALGNAKKHSIEIVLMTAPIDLVQVLDVKPELAKAIRRVHLMGGWVELKPPRELQSEKPELYSEAKQKSLPPPPPTIWGNYNLNMAPESSRRLFEMASEKGLFPIRLYTYRHVWEMFEGGVNRNRFPELINHIMQSKLHVLRDFRIAAKSWDEHAMRVMPYLTRFIGPYAGEQFSPADPILVVGLLSPDSFIKERRMVKVNVKQDQLEVLNDVLEVQIEYDVANSKIELITGLEIKVFRQELARSIFHCHKCGLIGHFARDCPNTVHSPAKSYSCIYKTDFYSHFLVCHLCRKPGHIARYCKGY